MNPEKKEKAAPPLHDVIYRGDCLEIMRSWPDGFIHTCVTSPPYWGLRDYQIEPQVWGGDAVCKHKWGEKIAVNATNHTGKIRWNHTRNGRDEEQPIEKRVAWLRSPVGQGNFCGACSAWRGSFGLEPTPELYVEHLVSIFREVRRVLRDDGTLWLNLGDSYNGAGLSGGKNPTVHGTLSFRGSQAKGSTAAPGLKPKDLVGIPWMVAFALRADGWFLRQDIIWSKLNCMPESVTDRCTKSHEYIFLLSKSERYHYDAYAIREKCLQDEMANGFRGGAYCNNATFDNVEGGKRKTRGNYRQPNSPQSIKSPFGQGFTRRAQESMQKVPTGWDTEKRPHGNIHRDGRTPTDRKTLPETQGRLGKFRDKQRGHLRNHDGNLDVGTKEEQCANGRNKRSVWAVECTESEVAPRRSGNKERKPRPGAPETQHGNQAGSVPWEGMTRNKRSVWACATQPFAEAHFATFPEKLIEPAILAGCPENGIVLDPFMGAGTTAAVSLRLDRHFIGTELNPEYIEIAQRRIAPQINQLKLFSR